MNRPCDIRILAKQSMMVGKRFVLVVWRWLFPGVTPNSPERFFRAGKTTVVPMSGGESWPYVRKGGKRSAAFCVLGRACGAPKRRSDAELFRKTRNGLLIYPTFAPISRKHESCKKFV